MFNRIVKYRNGSFIIFIPLILSLVSTITAIFLYISEDETFSFFTHWLPTYGKTVPLPAAHVFNTGIIIISPMMLMAHWVIYRFLRKTGARQGIIKAAFVAGCVSSLGEFLLGVIHADVNFTGHLIAALFFFIPALLFGLLYAVAELKLSKLPGRLGLSGLLLAGCFFVFTFLLIITQINTELDPNLPALWEWISYFSLLLWSGLHGLYLHGLNMTSVQSE